jgi:predicted ATPase
MIITTLTIENFKKFKNLTVELDRLACMVGGNNSGKSTILQALALFDFCLHQCLSKTNGKPITLKNRSISEEDFVVLPVTRGTDLWHDRILQAQNKHILISITATFDNGKKVRTKLDFNFNRFSIVTETDDSEEWLQELQHFKISYLPVFSTFQTKEEKRTPLAIRNELSRGNVNAVIRNLLLALKEKQEADNLTEILKRAFSSIKNIVIEFDEAAQQFIEVSYLEEGKKKSFDIFSAGSGFQQFIYLFGFIFLEQPNIILLDEPDVHLHGLLQKVLFNELQNLAAKENKQIIFATHSRDLISAVPPENIIRVDDNLAHRLSDDFEIFSLLDDLGSIENMELITLQEFRRVLMVENEDDWETLQVFGDLILGVPEMQKIRKRLTVLYAYGNPCKKELHVLRKQLQNSFKNKSSQLKMFVVADRDYFPYPEELIADLKKKELGFNNSENSHIEWHIWERNEIENYWVTPDIFMRLVKPKSTAQMTIDEGMLKDKFEELLEEQKDEIEGKFMKGFETYSKLFQKGWESETCLKKAKERMKTEWQNKLYYADAKTLQKKLLTWLQSQRQETFSHKRILQVVDKKDLPTEVHHLLNRIAKFVGA